MAWALLVAILLVIPAVGVVGGADPGAVRALPGMGEGARNAELSVAHALAPKPSGMGVGPTGVNETVGRMQWINWTQGHGSAIPGRTYIMMANDPAEGGVLAFGGIGANNLAQNDTWLFRNGTWTELCSGSNVTPSCPNSPSPNWEDDMVYDPGEQAVVLMASCSLYYCRSQSTWTNFTWVFQNGSWRDVTKSVAPPGQGPMAYDPAFGGLVMLVNGETWRFANNTWSRYTHYMQLQAPAQAGPLVYDAAEQRVLMAGTSTWAFGGSNRSGFNWTQLNLSRNLPAAPYNASYDPATHGVIVQGLSTGNSTWELQGSAWVNVTANLNGTPPFSRYPYGIRGSNEMDTPLVYDSSASYFVFLDTPGFRSNVSETWILANPLHVQLNESAAVIDQTQSVQYNVSTQGGLYPYDLDVVAAPPGCGAGRHGVLPQEFELSCTPRAVGGFQFQIAVTDSQGDAVNLTLNLTVHSAPSVTVVVTPDPTTVNVSVAFSASMQGGTPPYFEEWVWPNGTAEPNASFRATWATAGNYSIEEIAVDTAGYALWTNRTIQVNPGVRLTASVSTALTDAGVPVWFNASGAGGTAPLRYLWSLGNGNTSTEAETEYVYPGAGNFAPEIQVNDTVGAGAFESFHIVVHPRLEVALEATPLSPTAGQMVRLVSETTGGTPPYAEQWTFGPGEGVAGQANASVTFFRAGNWTANFTVTDALGVRVSQTLVVSVRPSSPQISGPSGTGSSGGLSISQQYAIGGVILLAGGILGGAVVWSRGRSRRPR